MRNTSTLDEFKTMSVRLSTAQLCDLVERIVYGPSVETWKSMDRAQVREAIFLFLHESLSKKTIAENDSDSSRDGEVIEDVIDVLKFMHEALSKKTVVENNTNMSSSETFSGSTTDSSSSTTDFSNSTTDSSSSTTDSSSSTTDSSSDSDDMLYDIATELNLADVSWSLTLTGRNNKVKK